MKYFEKTINMILVLLLVMMAGLFVYANLFHYTAHMESDTGAEAILGMVIGENNLVTPNTWNASTEKLVVSMPNLAAVIYKFNGNMNMSAGIACCVFLILMILVMIKFYSYIGMGKTGIIIATLIPFICTRNMLLGLKVIAVYACYYCPHIICFYLMAYTYAFLLKEKRPNYVMEALTVALAVLLGMQGFRAALMVFAPFFAGEVLRIILNRGQVENNNLRLSLWIFITFMTNAITSKLFAPYGGDTSFHIRGSIDKLANTVVPQLFQLFGMSGISFGLAIVLLILGFVGYVVSAVNKENEKTGKKVSLFIVMSLVVAIAALSLSSQDSTARYFIMLLFSIGAGCGLIYDLVSDTKIRVMVIASVMALSVLSFVADYKTMIVNDDSAISDEYMLVSELKAKGFSHGYASFDYADMLTAYSNGEVVVAAIQMDNLKAVRWQTDESWYPPILPADEKSFIVTTEHSKPILEDCMEKLGISEYEMFDCRRYTVYVFENNVVEW